MKTKIRKRVFLCFAVTLIFVFAAGSVHAVMPDVEGHWAEETINAWLEEGFVTGYEDETFRPDNSVTRAEFTAFTNRSFGFMEKTEHGFTDISEDAWYVGEIEKAAAAGYIQGYGDGTFRPSEFISRVEAASILHSLLNLEEPVEAPADAFNDAADIPEWGESSVNAVVYAGLMEGYEDNTFKPRDEITRAESVVILDRALEKREDLVDPYAILYLDKEQYYPDDTVNLTVENRGTDDVQLGHPFTVQKLEDNNWVEVPLDLAWIMVLEVLGPGDTLEQSFVPEEHFIDVEPEPGTYRVLKEVEYVETGKEETLTKEFQIIAPVQGLTDAYSSKLYCERYESLEVGVTLEGALFAGESITIDFTEPAEYGVTFGGSTKDIDVYPEGEISFQETVPAGMPIIIYEPYEDLLDGTAVEFIIDPGEENVSPPGMNLGCDDEDAWRESPHEIIFERSDSGAAASAWMEVAPPVEVTFIVLDEAEEPVEGAEVYANGEQENTDENGTAVFELVPRAYDYMVEKEGYEDAYGGIDLVDEPITEEVMLEEEDDELEEAE